MSEATHTNALLKCILTQLTRIADAEEQRNAAADKRDQELNQRYEAEEDRQRRNSEYLAAVTAAAQENTRQYAEAQTACAERSTPCRARLASCEHGNNKLPCILGKDHEGDHRAPCGCDWSTTAKLSAVKSRTSEPTSIGSARKQTVKRK